MRAAFEVKSTHVAGMKVHVVPGMETPNPLRYMRLKGDRIRRQINPRRMLTADDLNNIRTMFPKAVGIRVLIGGYVVVLFQTMSDMRASWSEGVPDTLGGFDVGYDIVDYRPSEFEVASGYAVTAKPEGGFTKVLSCKLKDGVEAITILAHRFVYLPGKSLVVRVANWFLKAKEALWRFRTPEMTEGTPAPVKINKSARDSPLRKDV